MVETELDTSPLDPEDLGNVSKVAADEVDIATIGKLAANYVLESTPVDGTAIEASATLVASLPK